MAEPGAGDLHDHFARTGIGEFDLLDRERLAGLLVGLDERIVLFNTGSGYKYLEALSTRY